MKKTTKKIWTGVLAGALLIGLCGCGSSHTKSSLYMDSAMEAVSNYADEEFYGESAESVEMVLENGSGVDAAAKDQDYDSVSERKLIRTVNMSVETMAFDNLLAYVETETKQAGGYIEELNVYNGSRYSYAYRQNGYYNDRSASLTLRIPRNELDDFLTDVAGNSNILMRTEKEVDVTLTYVDLESHKEVLHAEQERLIELMEQASTIEDMITLESRLSEIRYQIESMESKLRTYDNQVEYSTLYLDITEVVEFTEVKIQEESVWQRMGEGFVNSLKDIGDGFVEGFVGFIIILPYLILLLTAGLLIVWIVFFCIKRSQKRKKKENEGK